MSLHFSTLLSARLTWDSRVKELLDDIKTKIKNTVGYMAENMRDDLMNREFRKVTPLSHQHCLIQIITLEYVDRWIVMQCLVKSDYFIVISSVRNASHLVFIGALSSHYFSFNPFPFPSDLLFIIPLPLLPAAWCDCRAVHERISLNPKGHAGALR